jgi:two-component system CheB/CheR fusion protein
MSATTSTISKYGVALLAVAVAILARMTLTPWIGASFPLATMFTAVAFTVWYGGWAPALVTAIAGWFAAGMIFRGGQPFVGPSSSFNEAVALAVYLLSTGSVIVLGEAMRAAQRRLEEQREQLSTTNLALETKVEAQSLLAAIVASSDDAILSKTLDGRITSWNKGAERLFGYTAHEAIGKSIHLIVPPEGRDQETEILDRLRHGDRIDHLEVARIRKDGQRAQVEVTISPVHDRHGHIIGASTTARDITTRKEFETSLAQAAESLRENRDVLAATIAERERALMALKDADRRKDEFLATLAHELRNPLAPISSGLHIMKTAGGNPQVVQAAREIMERQVAQMVRLVDDLLDVARITTGKVELRCEVIDIADAVRDAVETSRPLIESQGQALGISLPDTPVHVNADRTRLAQVFANLLNNSAKFSERGQPISIVLARDDGHAMVRVRDAGAGIEPEALPKIFDMFGQADGARRARGAGLGIGLSLVKRIAEMHGGSVKAFSEGPGRGSEFVVRLPAAPSARVAADQPVATVSAGAAKRRILVVDDNLDAAESLATLLKIHGHETRMAHDGVQAVEAAAAFKPDVVFLDIGMPTIDGHETARRIRREPWGKDMVLVALTGWGQTEDRRRSKEAGFDHHLVKPADPHVVERLISSLA